MTNMSDINPTQIHATGEAPASPVTRFEFRGKRFLITRGTVEVNNPTRSVPILDIEAETRIRFPQSTEAALFRSRITAARLRCSWRCSSGCGARSAVARSPR